MFSPHVNFRQQVTTLQSSRKMETVTSAAHNFHSSSCNCSCYHSDNLTLRELIIFNKCSSTLTKCIFLIIRRKILEVSLLVRLASKIWPCVFIIFFFLELTHFAILSDWHWKFYSFESIRPSSKCDCFNKLKIGWEEQLQALKKESSCSSGNYALRWCISWIQISLFRGIIKSPTEVPLQNPWKIHDITTAASHFSAISFHCTLDNGHLTHTATPDNVTLPSW